MNTGLAIIIARTKTHPEEFCLPISEYRSRWLSLVDDFEKLMTDEEKEAWAEAKKGLNEYARNKRREDFTEQVMKELAGEGLNTSSYTEALALSMKNTKEVLAAGLMKTFAEQYKHEDFVNVMRIEK